MMATPAHRARRGERSLAASLAAAVTGLALAALSCDETIAATPIPDAGASVVDTGALQPSATPAERGKVLYGRYCDFCHGEAGQGYVADQAPSLANEEFLAIASDDYLKRSIARGRPGTVMSAWGREKGGPLDDAAVADVVAYIRTWQKRPYESVDARVVEGDAARGQATYDARCTQCHGAGGTGGIVLSLSNAEFLAVASDGFLATSIERGRLPTGMLAFSNVLDQAAVGDLVKLLRSWQKPVESVVVPLPPGPGALENVVIHPGGPEPSFDPAADFIPADVVKAELDRGATMIIADARAPSDYVALHIAGAIDVPFYQVEPYVGQLPKNVFVVTYCACPHAESSRSRDELRRLGYRASAIDEGILVWRDRGYPVRGGPRP